MPEGSLREGLFFDPQEGAWCGMHALNNYCLKGRVVHQQDCRDAARLVAERLTDRLAGDIEPISNHLNTLTGWLSIDVINVLGQANLGLHVDAASVSWHDDMQYQQDGAALLNWNNQHWTVLQRDPSGDGWMHTNSIEGDELHHRRRRHLSETEVEKVLQNVRRAAGAVALHPIMHSSGTQGSQYLEREGWQAMGLADTEEAAGDAGPLAKAELGTLSLVTLNVDGLGDYSAPAATRMDDIITRILPAQPDVLVFQEMVAPMLEQLRVRLPGWKICRRRGVPECYFNVTAMRHGSERTTSFPFLASANGRHLVTTRRGGWTIVNVHAESGSRQQERDARESQLLHMSRSHELEGQGQLCVLAGDFNLRAGEDSALHREGWRDVCSTPSGGEDWTWCRGSSTARYDRVFIHDAGEGDVVKSVQVRRLSDVWPALSDHVALHVVLRRRPQARVAQPVAHPVPVSPQAKQAPVAAHASTPCPMACASSATGQATGHAATGQATGQAATGQATGHAETFLPATGQAAHTPRPSDAAQAEPAPFGRAGAVPVVAIGNAIVQCAAAVRDANLQEFDGTRGAGELPAWSAVPKECGFKITRPGQRGHLHYATKEDKAAQCREYGRYKQWACEACGLAEHELKEQLEKASGLHQDRLGKDGLPKAFQRHPHAGYHGPRLKARDHAVLLCCVAGLRKAASGSEVGSLGGLDEMDRLLSLNAHQLQEACRAVPAHLRKNGSFAVEGVCIKDADARQAAVVGLFQVWLFNVSAIRLGAEAAWQQLLQLQPPQGVDANPASMFPLYDSLFCANDVLGALGTKRSTGGSTDANKVLTRSKHRVAGAWWRLVWQQACAEVCHHFGLERRCLQVPRARSPISAAGQLPPTTAQSLQLRLQELVANEDYWGAAAVQTELRALGLTQAEGTQGCEVGATTFEFSMEELYRTLFQAADGPERERQLNAVYASLEGYVRHTRDTPLRRQCGRLNTRDASTSVGSFDLRTRLTLWKCATMAWQDGWPTGRAPAEDPESESEAAAPDITPLPKAAVKDQGEGFYQFRGHKVQASSLDEAWRLLDDAYQEEQEQHAQVKRLKRRHTRTAARSMQDDALRRPGILQKLKPCAPIHGSLSRTV